jgi:hypothetical protein
MSMNRYVKIASNQGGQFSETNNLLDFDLDLDKVYNFDNSYIELMCSVSTTIPTAAAAGVAASSIGKVKAQIKNNTDMIPRNIMLVKNCELRSSNNGVLEDIRGVDTLRTTLLQYTQNHTVFDSENFKQVGSLIDRNNQVALMFQELQKQGSVLSKNLSDVPIRIKLSELFSLGSVKEFSTRQQGLGRVRIHLELQPEVLEVVPQTANDQNPNLTNPSFITKFNDLLETDNLAQITTSAAGNNSYELPDFYPWFTGMMIKVNATGAGGSAGLTDVFRSVEAVKYNEDNTVTLTLNATVGTLTAGQSLTDVLVNIVPADTASISYDFAELVVQEVSNPSNESNNMTYSTYTTEQVSTNDQVTAFQRLFQIEPECVNLIAMFPNPIYSNAPKIDDYRIRVDNVDTTNRNVEMGSSLYQEVLNNTFMAMGLNLRNLNEGRRKMSDTLKDFSNPVDDTEEVSIIGTPLYPTPNVKNLQLNINSTGTGTFSQINLYKQVIRSISM